MQSASTSQRDVASEKGVLDRWALEVVFRNLTPKALNHRSPGFTYGKLVWTGLLQVWSLSTEEERLKQTRFQIAQLLLVDFGG